MPDIDDLLSELVSAAQELGSDMPALGARQELEKARTAIRAEFEAQSQLIGSLTFALADMEADRNTARARVAELEDQKTTLYSALQYLLTSLGKISRKETRQYINQILDAILLRE
jgi:chromosome segregation ATPase